jgi:hypothetical protein
VGARRRSGLVAQLGGAVSIGPISPKAHGAWLGAGTGAAITQEIINLVQTYGHTTLPPALTGMLFTVVPALVAGLGAWLAPLLPSALESDAVQLAAARMIKHSMQGSTPAPVPVAPPLAPLPQTDKELVPTSNTAGWPSMQESGGSAA